MKDLKTYIDSGMLEAYASGLLDDIERSEVEKALSDSPELKEELDSIEMALEKYAFSQAVEPDKNIKPFVLAMVDYTERCKNGEPAMPPPKISETSVILDYLYWLEQPQYQLPDNFNDLYARIIYANQEAITAVVWIKDSASEEIHYDEYERFLIVEGTCSITIEKEKHDLKPGDFLSIPLYKKHFVKVTSAVPCKVILQRIAA